MFYHNINATFPKGVCENRQILFVREFMELVMTVEGKKDL